MTNIWEVETNNYNKTDIYQTLERIANEIKLSWVNDLDKTDAMKELIQILNEILSKDSLEEYFNNNEKDLKYFMTDFMQEITHKILIQPVVYGEDGDEIALDVLFHIFKLFLKFHKNKNYASLFEKIRTIINTDNHNSFFLPSNSRSAYQPKIDNPKKKYNFIQFNQKFLSDFVNPNKHQIFKNGDEVDILITYTRSRTSIDHKGWVRGKIISVNNTFYEIATPQCENTITENIYSVNLLPVGKKTKDWEWRNNLKKYDLIDCFDRNKWYPATICDVIENEIHGEKKISYKVGFRIYVDHFINKDDEKDTYDKHVIFWGEKREIEEDQDNEKFIGDKANFDEDIDCYSKRIQKFNTYTAVQKEIIMQEGENIYNSFSYGLEKQKLNKIQKMNKKLEDENEGELIEDDLYFFEKDGKKNYIFGKGKNFSYYYAMFLKKIADEDNGFEKFIEILKNSPNSEEIYNIFYTLYYAFPYLHKEYLVNNIDTFKTSINNFIDNLDIKEIRNLPKDLIELIQKFLEKVNKILNTNNKKEDENDENNTNNDSKNEEKKISFMDEISFKIALKMIKTSYFDKRLQGVKTLTEYINNKLTNKEIEKYLSELIQKNEIIKEIFGPNYHSQIISKSNDILSFLAKNNKLTEDDIKLIWDCTQRGDLEAKLTILKLLSELAKDLDENYINMLLNNIVFNISGKVNQNEMEFIYNLSIQGNNNENKIKCCEYLYQCLLKITEISSINDNPISEKLLSLIDNNEGCLIKLLEMCETDLKNNNSSLIVFAILELLIKKYVISFAGFNIDYACQKEPLKNFLDDEHLLNLFKNNCYNYLNKIKILSSNSNTEIDNIIVDGFTHKINMEKRLIFLNTLITEIYPSFDFLPFLKEILIDKAVSHNDRKLFYEVLKEFISSNNNSGNEKLKESKKKVKTQIFDLFVQADDTMAGMTLPQFELFLTIFFEINNNKLIYNNAQNTIHVLEKNLENLEGLDKLWTLIFKIKDENVLNKAISIMFQIYQSQNSINGLLEKCVVMIKKDDSDFESIIKSIMLIKKIIIKSEKNNVVNIKSHNNLLKDCVINLPLVNKDDKTITGLNDTNNINELFYGNTTIDELKEALVKKFFVPLECIEIHLSKDFINQFKKENQENSDLLLNENFNNKSILEIINDYNNEKNNTMSNKLLPEKIFLFSKKEIEKAPLLTNGNTINPKLLKILKDWYKLFTDNTMKMTKKYCAKFISCVTTNKETLPENDERITNFFELYDKENLGYVTEENFIEFYRNALEEQKSSTVWENLKSMNIRYDLTSKNEEYEIEYVDKSQLPRYTLGNDIIFIKELFKNFYKFEKKDKQNEISEFLFFLYTNKEIYDKILNNYENKDNDELNNLLSDDKKSIEQLYVLTIIESFLQDLDASIIDFNMLFNEDKNSENENNKKIHILSSKNYEPFDEININRKLSFVQSLILPENLQKFLEYINKLLINYTEKSETQENSVLIFCFEKGLKILSIIYNSCLNGKNTNTNLSTNEKGFFYFDYSKLASMMKKNENEKIGEIKFMEFTKNLMKFLKSGEKFKKNDILLNYGFSLLVNLLCNNEKLLSEIIENDEIKKILENILNNFLNINNINDNFRAFYIKCLINVIKNTNNENKFLKFLFEITNSMFNELITVKNKDIELNSNQKNSDNNSALFFFFEFFSLLYENYSKFDKNAQNNNLNKEFLTQIYTKIIEELEQTDPKKRLSKEVFKGLMDILLRSMENNPKIKDFLINLKINDKTLFNTIIQKNKSNDEDTNKKTDIINTDISENDTNKFISIENTLTTENKDDNLSEDIIKICNNYLKLCFKNTTNPIFIFELLKLIKHYKQKENNLNTDSDDERYKNTFTKKYKPKSYGHVGLKNIGCICYMNSIMQQIYMVPTFRYAIMGADDKKDPVKNLNDSIDDDNLLHQLQKMYTFLTFSENEDYNPKNFCYSFKDFDGRPTNPIVQQDSQEFYNNFCDKIENSLKNTKYKYIVNDVFTGRTCSSVICEHCKNISNRFEDFYNLTLEVKNITNLNDSLQKLIIPEKIDDFKCSNCNQKVTISKRSSLCNLPNVLVVHLKRFNMNYEIERTEKINSRFEFPKTLNLKSFCVEEIANKINNNNNKEYETEDIYEKDSEYYNYVLKGINIHMGSADGGHFFSLINVNREGKNNTLIDLNNENKINENQWLKFNDSHISPFDIKDIPNECFGGAEKNSAYSYENIQNAYLLIYERKKKSPIRVLCNENEIGDDKNNIIEFNKDNEKDVKKKYDLNKINCNLNESLLYKKIFHDTEKNEYFKLIPYYNIEKVAPKKIYNEVMQNNKKIKSKCKEEANSDTNFQKEFLDLLINNISYQNFNILSDDYDKKFICDLLPLVIDSIVSNTSKYNTEDEKKIFNDFTKNILDKIIKPIINNDKTNSSIEILLLLRTLIFTSNKLEVIFANDNTKIFDIQNVQSFCEIYLKLLDCLLQYNDREFFSLVNDLYQLLISNSNSSSYYNSFYNNPGEKNPTYYLYNLFFEICKKSEKAIEKFVGEHIISELIRKLSDESNDCKKIILDLVTFLIKKTKYYNKKLFNDESYGTYHFNEKSHLISSINSNIVELLFDEREELLTILIKIMQYREEDYSKVFNIEILKNLYEHAFEKNEIEKLMNLVFGILEINDEYIFERINDVLGYPVLIIKTQNNEYINNEENQEEEKAEEDKIEENNKKIKWPLFGYNLIKEEYNGDISKEIYKYICTNHREKSNCILALLFPETNSQNEQNIILTEKQKKDYIYRLLKICLHEKGNFILFKYIYLLQSRSIVYKNLYEEMIDILSKENDENYDLEEIKQNADKCIKYINLEITEILKSLKNTNNKNDLLRENKEIIDTNILPEKMDKSLCKYAFVQQFIGLNPNMLASDIVRVELSLIAQSNSLYLIREEYFAKYKNPEDLINPKKENENNIQNTEKKEENNINKEKKEEEKTDEEKKEEKNEEKNEEENEEKKEDEKNSDINDDDESSDMIYKIDLSEVKCSIDGKDFIKWATLDNLKRRCRKFIIEDSNIKDTNNVKSSLIRFYILSFQGMLNLLKIKVSEKDLPDEVKFNYYYPNYYLDSVEANNMSNFMNVNRVRSDLPFLKSNYIGINIDCKKM